MPRINMSEYISVEETAAEEITVEATPLEVTHSFEQLELAEDEVMTLESVVASLEAIEAEVTASLEAETLTPQAVRFVNLALAANGGQLGLEAEQFVSLESAEDATVSVEGIQDTIKKIWQAIKQAIAKAVTALQDFFAKLMGGVKKLRADNKDLIKAVGDLKEEDMPKEMTIANGQALALGGEVTQAGIAEGFKVSKQYGDTLFGTYATEATGFYKFITTTIKGIDELSAEELEALDPEIGKATEKASAVMGAATVGKGVMIGDKRGQVSFTTPPSIGHNVNARHVEGSVTIPTPSKEELISQLKAIDEILALIETKRDAIKKLNDSRVAASKETDKLVQAASSGKVNELVTGARVNIIMRAVNKNLGNVISAYCAFNFTSARVFQKAVAGVVKA